MTKKRGRKPGVRNRDVYPTDDTKRCVRCRKVKPLSEFYEMSKDCHVRQYSSHCKECEKSVTLRQRWRKVMDNEGTGYIESVIARHRKELAELETILLRHRLGQDVVNW